MTDSAARQVFVPTTLARLHRWCEAGRVDGSEVVGMAVTPEFAAAFGRAGARPDDEELLLEALADAAEQSRQLPHERGAAGAAVVLAVEAQVTERRGAGGRVRLAAPVPRSAWIAAYRQPDDAGDGRPDPTELAWYAVQELPDALA